MQLQTAIARPASAVTAGLRPRGLRPAAGARRSLAAAPGRRSLSVSAGVFDFLNKGKIQVAVSQAGEYDEKAIKAQIDKAIADNPCAVFSWTGCPFCKQAKSILDSTGAKYQAIELDVIPEGKAIRAELAKMTGRSSVPNVWIGGKNVGGCNDGPGVATLQSKGELVPMLKAAGAL